MYTRLVGLGPGLTRLETWITQAGGFVSRSMHNDTGVTPVQDRISVRRDEAKKVIGLIHVPDGLEQWPQVGTILAVGPRVQDPELVPGVRVLFKPRPASALIWDNREGGQRAEWNRVTQLREEDILGIVEEE